MQLATSYLSVSDYKKLPNDNATLLNRPDDQLSAILVRASGYANAIMKRNLLARERIEFITGDDTASLSLGSSPVIYVRQIEFLQPGASGYVLPASTILLDAPKGIIETYAPIALQGVGYQAVFPSGVRFAVTFASGYGYNPAAAPAWSSADAPVSVASLVPGASYTLGITTRTAWGETLPSLRTVTTSTGAITPTVAPTLGAFKYRLFLGRGATATTTVSAIAGATSFTFAANPGYAVGARITLDPMGPLAETVTVVTAGATLATTAAVNAHPSGTLVCPELTLVGEMPGTLFSPAPITTTIASAATPDGQYAEVAPLVDSSAAPTPPEIIEAVQLLALSSIYERNNLANRGIAMTVSGEKRTQWKSTEGSSGRGTPTLWQQAEDLLAGLKLSGVFGK
ncbi:MAG: hypothetical protein JWM87_734 [Candidatus Eremiobacteraeota bacterium]|nr:hypothetical protein [Candidatus Eremiobacteraeota bacterium]